MQTTGFSWADLVDEAVERSGGEAATASDVIKLRRGLRVLTEQWTTKDFNTWRMTHTIVGSATIPAASVRLAANVDDVIVANALRTDGTESPMQRITPSQYAQLATKTTGGQASQWYLARDECPTLFQFPTGPNQLSIWFVERPAAFDLYTNGEDDVPGRWLEAMVLGLAYDLARKRPPFNEPLIARLRGEYVEAQDTAQRADRDRTNYTYRTTRWRR